MQPLAMEPTSCPSWMENRPHAAIHPVGRFEREASTGQMAHKSGACFDWLYDLATMKNLEALLRDGCYKGPDCTEYPATHIFYQADKYKETASFAFCQGSSACAACFRLRRRDLR